MAEEKIIKCTVVDDKFVEPCDTLRQAAEHDFGRANARVKGILYTQLTNLKTRQPSRSFFFFRSKDFPKGMCLNFCPFCGVQIDTPFVKDKS